MTGLCTGSLLTSKDVLTASHCVSRRANRMYVKAGGRVYQARSVRIHPNVSEDKATGIIYNDLAIIHLQKPVSAPILPVMVSHLVDVGSPVTLYGFGLDGEGRVGVLKTGLTKISAIDQYFIQTEFHGGSDADSCEGDSGGPVVLSYRGPNGALRYGVVGVVSAGTSSACSVTEDDQSIYVNLQGTSAENFIKRYIPKAVRR